MRGEAYGRYLGRGRPWTAADLETPGLRKAHLQHGQSSGAAQVEVQTKPPVREVVHALFLEMAQERAAGELR